MPIIICNAQIVFLLHTLKKKVIYWLLWFHEEHLTFMEALHCTKGSGKGYLGYYNVLHTTVKVQKKKNVSVQLKDHSGFPKEHFC